MKKIFTLIAVAMMAVGTHAQTKVVFSATETYSDSQVITSGQTKLTLKSGFHQYWNRLSKNTLIDRIPLISSTSTIGYPILPVFPQM
jgi:hypothetical protein